MIRVRIAPSPTGNFHIGTARTALYNYLFARANKGVFVVRVEDTDEMRSEEIFEKDIIDGLQWLGLSWDEGPDIGGPFGPYRQSERTDIYRKYLHALYEKGMLYRCYCTPEELEKERQDYQARNEPPRYSGKCRAITDADRIRFEDEGKNSVLRFRVPVEELVFTDLVRGDVSVNTGLIGDMVVAKDMDSPLYNFAVVVDDSTMEITHVISGEDHISNTHKQILIQRALGFPLPQYAHIPLILNPDRSKLSKRKNKVSLIEYRTEGFLPEALINCMALIGWNPGGEQEIFSLDELASAFSLERVHKAGAIFDIQKLRWINAQYIRAKDTTELTHLCLPYFVEKGYITPVNAELFATGPFVTKGGREVDFAYCENVVAGERERIEILSEITDRTELFFVELPDYDPAILTWKGMSTEAVHESLLFAEHELLAIDEEMWNIASLEERMKSAIADKGLKNGEVLWPLRVALTGLEKSPSPFEVAAILGKAYTISRIQHALSRV